MKWVDTATSAGLGSFSCPVRSHFPLTTYQVLCVLLGAYVHCPIHCHTNTFGNCGLEEARVTIGRERLTPSYNSRLRACPVMAPACASSKDAGIPLCAPRVFPEILYRVGDWSTSLICIVFDIDFCFVPPMSVPMPWFDTLAPRRHRGSSWGWWGTGTGLAASGVYLR